MRAVAIIGGALNPPEGEYLEGVKKGVELGMGLLKEGWSALEVAQRVAEFMEDLPVFNCGTGSRLNMKGDIEMDACIMDGKDLRAGAVGCIQKVKNPVAVARKVMEETDHILLVGAGATTFARAMGFPEYDPSTELRRREWEDLINRLRNEEPLPERFSSVLNYWQKLKGWIEHDDTVGVLACDEKGHLAAATSSGGAPLKMPGRIGDVPLVGSGIYANEMGAAVLSGNGEAIVKLQGAKTIVDCIAKGSSPREAAAGFVSLARSRMPGATISCLCMDSHGTVGAARNVKTTPFAYLNEQMEKPATDFAEIVSR